MRNYAAVAVAEAKLHRELQQQNGWRLAPTTTGTTSATQRADEAERRLLDNDYLASWVEPVAEAVAPSNLLAGLAFNRHFASHAVGALGFVELTAPDRTCSVHAIHSTIDIAHSRTWNREVIAPLVAENPSRARAIAEGALMRLRGGERCFIRYRQELGVRA